MHGEDIVVVHAECRRTNLVYPLLCSMLVVSQYVPQLSFRLGLNHHMLDVHASGVKQTCCIENTNCFILTPIKDEPARRIGCWVQVAIALSMLVAEVTAPPFNETVCTFSAQPQLHTLKGDSLVQKVMPPCSRPLGHCTVQNLFSACSWLRCDTLAAM